MSRRHIAVVIFYPLPTLYLLLTGCGETRNVVSLLGLLHLTLYPLPSTPDPRPPINRLWGDTKCRVSTAIVTPDPLLLTAYEGALVAPHLVAFGGFGLTLV
ncbi:MAG: hypothetical protein AAGE59_32925, partial [Cyanobacteria bacterium P01_F01_bin.86]